MPDRALLSRDSSGQLRRYVAVVQDGRGYAASGVLEPAPPEGPEQVMLYTVVKADQHEEAMADAETLARAVSASLTHGEESPLADALKAYLQKHPWSDL